MWNMGLTVKLGLNFSDDNVVNRTELLEQVTNLNHGSTSRDVANWCQLVGVMVTICLGSVNSRKSRREGEGGD